MAAFKRKQIRFSAQEDINLLKEVLAQNPFHSKNWTTVAEKVSQSTVRENFNIDGRRARERTALLMDQFESEESEALKRSGSDEEITEKKQLLQEISDLEEEESRVKEGDKGKPIEEKAKEIRKRALETLTPQKGGNVNDEELQSVTPTKRSTSANVMSYLQEKIAAEKKIKEDEVAVRKEELSLERERFELERNERLQKLENDRQQNMLMMELLKQLTKK